LKKPILYLSVLLAALLFFTGCTTVTYAARPTYVGFSNDGAKTVEQTKKTSMYSDDLYSTYDDEFVYDEDGSLIKHIQTHFFSDGEKYTQHVVHYQKIGEFVLPKSVSINGFVYMEVEYDLLATEHQGKLTGFNINPVFYQEIRTPLLFQYDQIKWDIDLANFKVPFRSDSRFVTTDATFDYFTGLSEDKVLTLGYDNVVLKRFYFSPTKYRNGYNVSHAIGNREATGTAEEDDKINTTFTYEWEVIADKIVQTGMVLVEKDYADNMTFRVFREFDEAGRRISEEWTVEDSLQNIETPVVLYTQKMSY